MEDDCCSKDKKPKCDYFDETGTKRCFFDPEGEPGKCYAPKSTKKKNGRPFQERAPDKQKCHTGGEETAKGLAGGGREDVIVSSDDDGGSFYEGVEPKKEFDSCIEEKGKTDCEDSCCDDSHKEIKKDKKNSKKKGKEHKKDGCCETSLMGKKSDKAKQCDTGCCSDEKNSSKESKKCGDGCCDTSQKVKKDGCCETSPKGKKSDKVKQCHVSDEKSSCEENKKCESSCCSLQCSHEEKESKKGKNCDDGCCDSHEKKSGKDKKCEDSCCSLQCSHEEKVVKKKKNCDDDCCDSHEKKSEKDKKCEDSCCSLQCSHEEKESKKGKYSKKKCDDGCCETPQKKNSGKDKKCKDSCCIEEKKVSVTDDCCSHAEIKEKKSKCCDDSECEVVLDFVDTKNTKSKFFGKKNKDKIVGSNTEQVDIGKDKNKISVNLSIEGMDCSGCAVTLESHVKKLQGISHITTSVLTSISVVTYDVNHIKPNEIVDHINLLSNLTAAIIEDALSFTLIAKEGRDDEVAREIETQKGVMKIKAVKNESEVNRGSAFEVYYDSSLTGVRTICDALSKSIPEADPVVERAIKRNLNKDAAKEKDMRIRFWVSLILSIPIIICAFILPPAYEEFDKIMVGGLPVKFLVQWIFATPLQLILSVPIYKSAWSAAKYLHEANMDTLISISTSVAYFYSVGICIAILILGGQASSDVLHDVFFETSALVLVLVLLGRYLESLAKRQTSNALTQILQLQPETTLLVCDGEDKLIPSYLIQRGDILKVLPGEKVPTDGKVLSGTTSIDESMLTGESLPVKKKKNKPVFGGTVNMEGMITMCVTKIPGETELDNIASQLEKTQMSKASIERITDIIASKFVFVVLSLAIAVFVIWLVLAIYDIVDTKNITPVPFAMRFALAVLIVSCPCAVGLAAPTAVMVGSGVAAKKHHLLFKGGDIMEMCAKINTICFDKTGTLTEGKLTVIDTKLFKKTSKVKNEDDLLFYTATAELGSEHPIGRTIVSFYQKQKSKNLKQPINTKIIPGKGIIAVLEDKTIVRVGTSHFLKEELDIKIPTKMVAHTNELREKGATVVYTAVDDYFVGSIAMSDTIKPSALSVIDALKNLNVEVWMVTGDHKSTATFIASQLGIENIVAEASPLEKSQLITDLQEEGKKVAMLGDGVNDAVALGQANVGIAVGTAADLSMEVADLVMLSDNLNMIVVALDLCKTVYRRIKINLAWSFLYNIIAIPLAAGVLYTVGFSIPPAFAGISDLISSVPVILFSLLLHYYKPPKFNDELTHITKINEVIVEK